MTRRGVYTVEQDSKPKHNQKPEIPLQRFTIPRPQIIVNPVTKDTKKYDYSRKVHQSNGNVDRFRERQIPPVRTNTPGPWAVNTKNAHFESAPSDESTSSSGSMKSQINANCCKVLTVIIILLLSGGIALSMYYIWKPSKSSQSEYSASFVDQSLIWNSNLSNPNSKYFQIKSQDYIKTLSSQFDTSRSSIAGKRTKVTGGSMDLATTTVETSLYQNKTVIEFTTSKPRTTTSKFALSSTAPTTTAEPAHSTAATNPTSAPVASTSTTIPPVASTTATGPSGSSTTTLAQSVASTVASTASGPSTVSSVPSGASTTALALSSASTTSSASSGASTMTSSSTSTTDSGTPVSGTSIMTSISTGASSISSVPSGASTRSSVQSGTSTASSISSGTSSTSTVLSKASTTSLVPSAASTGTSAQSGTSTTSATSGSSSPVTVPTGRSTAATLINSPQSQPGFPGQDLGLHLECLQGEYPSSERKARSGSDRPPGKRHSRNAKFRLNSPKRPGTALNADNHSRYALGSKSTAYKYGKKQHRGK